MTDRATGAEAWHALFEDHWAWVMEQHPESATSVGWPTGHDRWTDWSLDAVARRQAGQRELLDRARGLPVDGLGDQDALSAELLLWDLQTAVEGHRFPGHLLPLSNISGPHQRAETTLASMPLATAAQGDVMVERLRALGPYVDQVAELLREGAAKGVLQPAVALRGVPGEVAVLADPTAGNPLLRHVASLEGRVDPMAAKRVRDAAVSVIADVVAPAFQRLHDLLVEEHLPAGEDGPIACMERPDGEAWYAHLIRAMTTTDLTAEEIHSIGLDEVARLDEAMGAVMAEGGFAGDREGWAAFLRSDDRFFCGTPEQLLAEYRDIAKRADPELARLFGTLPRNPYGVCAVPEHTAPQQTTAYYVRGSSAAGRPGWFFANTYDLRSRPRWEMEALTLHEAVPGHHLQIGLAQELDGLPAFRRSPSYTGYVEGWGLYAESLGTEMGFYRDPYSRYGQLSYEMWRAIRLVVDTGIHALGWSRDEAIAFFEAHSAKPRHDIEVEIDRYIAWPGQALAYKLGERTFHRLRREAADRLGERFDIRAFHDAALLDGALPLVVLERRTRAWIEREAAAG